MTHMYFSARTEGRISYGHLGRTNSCLLRHKAAQKHTLYKKKNTLIKVIKSYKILNYHTADGDNYTITIQKNSAVVADKPRDSYEMAWLTPKTSPLLTCITRQR